jgi:hypothetical protein
MIEVFSDLGFEATTVAKFRAKIANSVAIT